MSQMKTEFISDLLSLYNLTDAVIEGDLKRVKDIISNDKKWLDMPLNEINDQPIHLAVSYGHLEITNYLLNIEPDLGSQVNSYGKTPLILAAIKGKFKIVQAIVEKASNSLNLSDHYNQTPLLWAARYGHSKIVAYLINNGANLNSATKRPNHITHERTPLEWAAECNHLECVTILLNAGALTMNLQCIHIASKKGYLEMIRFLIERDSNSLNATDSFNQTPLLLSAANGHIDIMQLLIDYGADLDFMTIKSGHPDHGKTALDWAKKYRHDSCVKILQGQHLKKIKEKFASQSDLQTYLKHHGQSHLFNAIYYGHIEIIKYLEIKGVALHNLAHHSSDHPIHLAAKRGHLDIVCFYLENNPELLNRTNIYNQTPLLCATIKEHTLIVKYLLSKEPDLSVTTQKIDHPAYGKTALEWAHQKGFIEIKRLLTLKLIHQGKLNLALKYINRPRQILELMHLDPTVQAVLLKNDKIIQILNNTSICSKNNQNIVAYKTAGRRNSFFLSFNKETGECNKYQPVTTSGKKGHSGEVRQFINENGQSIAVKSLINSRTDWLEIEHKKYIAKREFKLLKLAQPNNNIYHLFHFEKTNYNYRFIQPFFEGETVNLFFSKIQCKHKFSTTILKLSEALQSLHEKNIVHGDIKENNIIILEKNNHVSVHIIDYGLAHTTRDSSAFLNQKVKPFYAPERTSYIKPHPSQDIFSFGYMLRKLLNNDSDTIELNDTYPSIEKFIYGALNIEPNKRPTLKSFIKELSEEINKCNPEHTNMNKVANEELVGIFRGETKIDFQKNIIYSFDDYRSLN